MVIAIMKNGSEFSANSLEELEDKIVDHYSSYEDSDMDSFPEFYGIDYFIDENDIWQIRVSKMSDWRYEFLVAFHELLEMAWCIWHKVKVEDVDAFDIAYEENRKPGDKTSEPGNDPTAPYYMGHQMATIAEKLSATILGVNWDTYEAIVEFL